MAEDIGGDTGGRYAERTYEEKYPDMAEGRPEEGWSAQKYGYSDEAVLVAYSDQARKAELESMGLEVFDVFTESDDETYYVMAPPASDTGGSKKDSVSTYEKLEANLMNWDVDIDDVNWGSIIPGLDIRKDTMDVAGLSATVERKGSMIKCRFTLGGKETVKCYDFGSEAACNAFLGELGHETGIDFYTTEGY